MVRVLIKTETLTVGDWRCPVRYFAVRTARGGRRFSAEIVLGPEDRIILDEDSLTMLAARVQRVAPATVYSRRLARTPAA